MEPTTVIMMVKLIVADATVPLVGIVHLGIIATRNLIHCNACIGLVIYLYTTQKHLVIVGAEAMTLVFVAQNIGTHTFVDCDDPDLPITGCYDGQICGQYGTCSTWSCGSGTYNAGNGCDCECGDFDPGFHCLHFCLITSRL